MPSQRSSTSHSFAATRQMTLLLPAVCEQTPDWQASTVQTFPSLVHAVPFAVYWSAGHEGDTPSHDSAVSHSPTDGRHTEPAFPAGCWHTPAWHWSDEQEEPSSVQAVPSGRRESAGQVEAPPHVSAE